MKKLIKILSIGALVTFTAAGCSKGDEQASETESDDTRAPKKEAKDNERDEVIAFVMGGAYGYACVFALLDKPELVSEKMAKVTTMANALGIDAPAAPSKSDAVENLRASTEFDAIKDKHGNKVAAAYALGITLTDASFGSQLNNDISDQLSDVKKHARAAGIPKRVYAAPLEAAKADVEEVSGLTKSFKTYFKSST